MTITQSRLLEIRDLAAADRATSVRVHWYELLSMCDELAEHRATADESTEALLRRLAKVEDGLATQRFMIDKLGAAIINNLGKLASENRQLREERVKLQDENHELRSAPPADRRDTYGIGAIVKLAVPTFAEHSRKINVADVEWRVVDFATAGENSVAVTRNAPDGPATRFWVRSEDVIQVLKP